MLSLLRNITSACSYRWLVLRRGMVDACHVFGWWTLLGTPACFLVGWSAHYAVLHWFPEAERWLGEPMAEWWINIVYLLVPLVVIVLIVAFFNVLMAPSRIWREQQEQINNLQASNDHPLGITFDRKRNIEWTDSDKTVCWVTIDVTNDSAKTFHNSVVFIRSIEPLNNKREFRKYLKGWSDVPMRMTKERTLSRQDRTLPSQEVSLIGNSSLRYDLLVWKSRRGNPTIFHSEYTIKELYPQRGPVVTRWESHIKGNSIPLGRFVVTIEVRAPSGESAELCLKIGTTTKTIRVKTL